MTTTEQYYWRSLIILAYFRFSSRSQRRATWRSCCVNCVFVAQKLQRSTKTEDVDQVHRVGSRKGWEAYGVAFQVCGSGCFNGGSTSELHGRDGCGEWLPMKSGIFVITITVFPHIVSAETILFWIWKSKGHTT